MKKTSMVCSAIALFALINAADAVEYSGGQHWESSTNTILADDLEGNGNATLSAWTGTNIVYTDDQIAVVGDLDSFKFDSEDGVSPYVLRGNTDPDAVDTQGLLEFNAVNIGDVSVKNSVVRTTGVGQGIYFIDSTIGNLVLDNATLDSDENGLYAENTVFGSFTIQNGMTSAGTGVTLESDSSVTGDVNISGDIVSGGNGFGSNATIDGNVIVNSNFETAGTAIGFYSGLSGDFTLTGNVSANAEIGGSTAIQVGRANNVTVIGDVDSGLSKGIGLYNGINGDLYVEGNLTGADNGVMISDYTAADYSAGNVTIIGNIDIVDASSPYNRAIGLHAKAISGDFKMIGNVTSDAGGVFVEGAKNFEMKGDIQIDSTDDAGIAINKNIEENFIYEGNIVSASRGIAFYNPSTPDILIKGNIETTGNVSNNEGVMVAGSGSSSFTLIGDVISAYGRAIALFSHVENAVNITGDVTSTAEGAYSSSGEALMVSAGAGSVTLNGNAYSGYGRGVGIYGTGVDGAIKITGDITGTILGSMSSYDTEGFILSSSASADSITLIGDIYSGYGRAVGIYGAVTGDIKITGNVSGLMSSAGNAEAVEFHAANSITMKGDITSELGSGVMAYGNIAKDLTITGTMNALNIGAMVGRGSVVGGAFKYTGNINAATGLKVGEGATVGSLLQTGNIVADTAAVKIESSSHVLGDLTVKGELSGALGIAVHQGSSVGGSIYQTGNISATDTAVLVSESAAVGGSVSVKGDLIGVNGIYIGGGASIGGYVSQVGNIVADEVAFMLTDGSDITGNLKIIGDMTGGTNGVQLRNGSSIAGGAYIEGDISGSDVGLALTDSFSLTGDMTVKGNVTGGEVGVEISTGASVDGAVTVNGDVAGDRNGVLVNRVNGSSVITTTGDVTAAATEFDVNGDASEMEVTAGIKIEDSLVGSKIVNSAGEISGQYGIISTISIVEEDLEGNYVSSYGMGEMTIVNAGKITGLTHDAIAFDLDETAGNDFDNILNYSGRGELVGAIYDINMGAGEDVLNANYILDDWFVTNGVETISATDVIFTSVYDGSSALATHDDTATTQITFANAGFLIDTDGVAKFEDGLDLLVIDSAVSGVFDSVDLSELHVQLEGYQNTEGYFYLQGDDLMYHIDSVGTTGGRSDQGVAVSSTPLVSVLSSSLSVTRSAMDLVSSRMTKHAKLKDGVEFASIQSDIAIQVTEDVNPTGVWMQGFGEMASYDGKDDGGVKRSTGYDSSTYGMVIGYDHYMGNGLVLGGALAYATTTVDGNRDEFSTDVTQYQLTAYGIYTMDKVFIDGQIGFGQLSYDQSRYYVGNDATAQYDGSSMNFGIGAGYVYDVDMKTSVVPYARLTYVNASQDEYTESWSDLVVNPLDLQSTQLALGAELNHSLKSDGGVIWKPRLTLEYAQELGDQEIAVNNTLNGTEGYAPDLGDSIIRAGVGVSVTGADQGYNVSLDYKFETRDRYTSHGFIVNGKYFF